MRGAISNWKKERHTVYNVLQEVLSFARNNCTPLWSMFELLTPGTKEYSLTATDQYIYLSGLLKEVFFQEPAAQFGKSAISNSSVP